MPSDIDLLEMELRTIWRVDAGGRLVERELQAGLPLAVVATARTGWRVAFAAAVPDETARALRDAVRAGPHSTDPATRPAYIDRCNELLATSVGQVELTSGPSFRVPPGLSPPATAAVIRSGSGQAYAIEEMRPQASGWTADEWQALARGDLGPWAAVAEGARVVSICHCSRLTEEAAEAGTWTEPAYRGRGYAAAATAAWASLMAPMRRHLFYSTSADNASSQAVATRLGLPLIGWTWRLSAASTGA